MASNSDSDSENAAMAAAMGFASFGAKKRKFNRTTDAFMEGQALEKIDRGGKKGAGSGGNKVPLGRVRVVGAWKEEERERAGNDDEIALDEDEDMEMGRCAAMRGGGAGEGPQYLDTSQTPPAAGDEHAGRQQLGGPPIFDMDIPTAVAADAVTDAEAEQMQRRIDAILQRIGSVPPPPGNNIDIDTHAPPPGMSSYTTATMLSPPPPPSTNLPSRGAAAPGPLSADSSETAVMQGGSRGGFVSGGRAISSRGARSETGSDWGGSTRGGSRGGFAGKGGRNKKWWVEYYDPTFNTNPWESLEKERGLKSVGSWLECAKKLGRGD